MSLTDEQIREVKETFSLFDKDGDGIIHSKDVQTILRALCYNPAEQELNDIMKDMDKSGSDLIDFNEFLRVYSKKAAGRDKEASLLEALQVFDREKNGTIRTTELKHVIISLGEKLTDDDVDQLIKEADSERKGVVDIRAFAKMLLEK